LSNTIQHKIFFHIMNKLLKPFKRTYIEITNSCNLACEFCPGTTRKTEFMDPGMFKTVLSKLGEYSTHLYFHVLGEPLLHTHLSKLLDIAHDHGKLVNLVTNGTLIQEKGPLILGKPALRQVTFSLHSFVPGKQIVSVERYLEPIVSFARQASKNHLICLRLWDADAKADSTGGAAVIRFIEKEFRLPYSLEEKLLVSSGIPLEKNIFLNKTNFFDWPDADGPDYGDSGFCLGLRQQIAILVDGTVVPCCLDRNGDMALGNILNETMGQILESRRAQGIYSGFSRHKVMEPLCRHCSYRLRFNLSAL
jgi:radical SAM protein with 4Fe4S-binding SPASM domain